MVWSWRDQVAQIVKWKPPPAPPPPPPLPAAEPILLSQPKMLFEDESLALFEEPAARILVRFIDSGDDLYAMFLVVSDRRGGRERITAEDCQRTAELFLKGAPMDIDVESCATNRNLVKRLKPTKRLSGVRFVTRDFNGRRATYAEMDGYGERTELWEWRWSEAKKEYEAISWGVPPILELPGEPAYMR
jgi:hypothetical protein